MPLEGRQHCRTDKAREAVLYHSVLLPLVSCLCFLLAEPRWKPNSKGALIRKLKGVCSLPWEKRQRNEENRWRGSESQGCVEVANKEYNFLNGVSLSSSQSRNICEPMYAKHYVKGHGEQHLAATSRNILFFVGEIEISIRELNYKTEKK